MFLRWGVISMSPNPQAGGPSLVGCPQMLIQYIRNYPPHWRLILHPQLEDMPCHGDRDPLITVFINYMHKFKYQTSFLKFKWSARWLASFSSSFTPGPKNLCHPTIHHLQGGNNIHRLWNIMPEFKFAILGKCFTKQTISYKNTNKNLRHTKYSETYWRTNMWNTSRNHPK